MWDILSMLGKFQDIIAKIIENRDKIGIKHYDVEQYGEVVTVVIMARDEKAGTLIREIIESTLNRLYEMQGGGGEDAH